ncbi:hypothetical protein TWF730_010429 [Orbilia blumenaviensis]|uniref:Uncharacterized protein n=1 Tax=Orbilia blumenaviensis TaxID=1796055 RepID=A0AAV9USQ5_9PEZI
MDPEVISHYYVLDIEHDARDAQIKMAFHRRSLKWHPDKNPNVSDKKLFECNAMMQKLNDAYTCLRDPKARGIYELRCASIVFTHEDDPGNWFRKQFEAERRSREEAAQRRRKEEQERNAARQQERQEQECRRKETEEREQRRREAEEQERRRKETEEREQRRREAEEKEQRRSENETREAGEQRRRNSGEQEQEEQAQGQSRPGTQEQQSRTTNPKFTAQEWESFFNLLRILIVLQKLASESNQTGTGSHSKHSASEPSDFGDASEAPRFTSEEPFKDNFSAGSKPSNYYSKQTKRSEFGPVPAHSSRARWSDSELEALLKLRRDYPYEKWDTIASRLNAKFGNGRNGNAVRQKHSKHSH